ncbi:hypothetical protein FNV43_RR20213 [Rhamnella rubrinervis]|uniref:Essential protein Yae1 N-terminal domain-containing protein n=1 Tax=Rhamnella rubrinervis TaxID=2594499 RepID=A0A8K0E124_9ROSA|nr:hypothetical protein FNV43_RR20213 [Rhamnella rubrinervis]
MPTGATDIVKMKGSFAEELYSESLQKKIETDPMPSAKTNHSDSYDGDRDDFWHEDGSLWDGADQEVAKESELDREWQRRHDQFHTIGYRDGLIAGKEAAAQDGFNTGFKESVIEGYNWGLVRGVTSALALLPDGLKERLIDPQEKRTEFQKLYESAHSLSTQDALRLFNDALMAKKAAEQGEKAEVISFIEGLQEQRSERNPLENYSAELRSLLLESPAIEVHFSVDK